MSYKSIKQFFIPKTALYYHLHSALPAVYEAFTITVLVSQ